MAVLGLALRRIGSGAARPHPANTARAGAPPRPGADGLVGANGSNGTANTFSVVPDHSPGLDAIAALVGIVFIILIAGGIWLFSRFRRTPHTPPVAEQQNRSATIEMLNALSMPMSKKEWQSALNEKEDALVKVIAQDSCAICLEPVEDSDDIRPLPCSHVFHQACFDKWFWKTDHPTKCPLCRTEFIDPTLFPRVPEESHIAP